MTIRVGVVGLGMGRAHALAYHRARPRCELVWVADLDASRAEAVAKETGARPLGDWQVGLDDVDAVSLCTPHHLHAPQAIAALEAGRHVLVEKPMALTESECRSMIAAARANDRRLMVAYVVRFNPAVSWLKRALDEKRFGEVFNVEAWTEAYLPPQPNTWFARRAQLGGGVLFSHGCHYIDIITWLLGQPESVCYLGTRLGTAWMEGEGTAQSLMRFANGAVAHYACSWGTRHTLLGNRLHVHTTEGLLVLDYGRQTVELVDGRGRQMVFQTVPDPERPHAHDPVDLEVHHFLDCIETGQEPQTGGEEALKSLRVIWAMYAQEAARGAQAGA